MLTVTKTGNWRLYWGVMPLPNGAEALGIVKRDTGTGALIRLANGNYVQGNAGGIRTLPQHEVEEALDRSNAAAALGSIKSPHKAQTSAANGRKGGRPKVCPICGKPTKTHLEGGKRVYDFHRTDEKDDLGREIQCKGSYKPVK